jgi:hypothetical protein
MDFLKENLFYVVLAAAVIVVSVPSYIVGAQRRDAVRKAQSDAERKVKGVETKARSVRIVPPETMAAAKAFKEGMEQEKEKLGAILAESDERFDNMFLVSVDKPGAVPDGKTYKAAYYAAFDELNERIVKAGLKTTEDSPLGERDEWSGTPSEFDIRVTQKRYWILKALVDIVTDPECGIMSVQSIRTDHVPNGNGDNRPHGSGMFWIYPIQMEFSIDFRKLPVFLDKLVGNEDIFFDVPGFLKLTRSFDESKAVYVPAVSLTFYFRAWDYISTPFEKQNLKKYRNKPKSNNRNRG